MFNARQTYREALRDARPDPLATVIGEAIGAASVCWDDDGIFQSERAKAISEDLTSFIREHGRSFANDKAEIYRDKAGRYRYRIIAGNGRVVDDATEGYSTRWSATRAARRGRPAIVVKQIRR